MVTNFISKNEAETLKIAADFARRISSGTVVALYGTLGAGKSAFCRGFIQSLCKKVEDVPSPTFTLLQTYEAPLFEIYHFDMYRLKTPYEAYELGIEDAFLEGVSLIEWPEKIGSLLPKNAIRITFQIQEDQSRLITIEE
ncbi:MAG: tRNA (adenosine(37)-N6)-threonylcarbamoyltransferase complex ATPase subunit type 1 TsaE [Alphaproteobacteria bacterium]|nr:tRNA (adenosine(37)-N6)-threonylcarbamoyltransferase complex ATPase subunit type 1 TsaE [Alphaproteobacteria bacterium]